MTNNLTMCVLCIQNWKITSGKCESHVGDFNKILNC